MHVRIKPTPAETAAHRDRMELQRHHRALEEQAGKALMQGRIAMAISVVAILVSLTSLVVNS